MSLHSSHPDDIPLLGGINKPLNLANLGKKQKPSIEEHPPHKPIARRSFEDDANRPFSPSFKAYKPLANQRGMKAAPSSPFFPSTASFQSMSAFRTPRVPSPTKRHSAASIDSLNINNAHTTTGRDDLEHVDDINHYEDTSHDGPLRLARSGTRDLEDQTDQTNENRSRNGLSGGTEGFSYDGTASAFEDRYTRMPARRVQKRVERAENDVERAYTAPKRYKLDDDQEVYADLDSDNARRLNSAHSYRATLLVAANLLHPISLLLTARLLLQSLTLAPCMRPGAHVPRLRLLTCPKNTHYCNYLDKKQICSSMLISTLTKMRRRNGRAVVLTNGRPEQTVCESSS